MKKERNYDFRKRMLQVHRKDVRDYTLMPQADEYVINNGFCVTIPDDSDLVVETAARDFVDYLFTSMNVSAMLSKKTAENAENSIRICINQEIDDASETMGYRITTENGILLEGYDSRGITQGLYHLEDIMNLRMAPFLPKGVETRRTMFTYRCTMSGYGVDMYPDNYLCRLAHEGITAISLWINDVNETLLGQVDFNELAYRASKYGIDIYIQSFIHHSMHPEEEGAQEFYDKLYGQLFEKCPYIKGFVVIGEASQFASRDPRVGKAPHSANCVDGIPTGKISPGWWPCYDWPDLLRMIQKAVYKYKPDAEIILCSYNWGWAPEEERVRLLQDLPKGITILSTWEMFEHYDLNGCDEVCCDYTIRYEGPGQYFLSEAKAATKLGLKVYSISNTTGRTWDFGVIPYMPAPYQWIKRYKNVREAYHNYNLRGLNEAHHYGVYPSFITELEKWAFTLPEVDMEDVLLKILGSHFGKENVSCTDKALRIWSEAFTYAIPSNEDQYGAFRIGPSYPFWIAADDGPPANKGEGAYPPMNKFAMHSAEGMFSNSYKPCDDGTPCQIRVVEELKSIQTMAELILQGLDVLETIENKNEELEYLINMGWFMYRTTLTGINQKRFYIATNQYKCETDREKLHAAVEEIERILVEERDNALQTIPIVENDSILGWEPSMEYTTDKEHLLWKIRQVDYMLGKIPEMKSRCFV